MFKRDLHVEIECAIDRILKHDLIMPMYRTKKGVLRKDADAAVAGMRAFLRGILRDEPGEDAAGHDVKNGVCQLCDAGDPTSIIQLSDPCAGR